MLLFTLIFASVAVAASLSAPIIHEERDVSRINLHGGESRRVDPNAILPIRIALTQSNLDKGYDYVMQVSGPDSESFGKHWTLEEIHKHFAPSAEAREAVTAWLESSGIDREDVLESTSTGWLGIDVPASVAEALFVTEYYESRGADGAADVGCDKYHIPSHLSDHIDFITPGVGSSSLHKRSRPVASQPNAMGDGLLQRRATNFTDLPCERLITPACIRQLYDIPVVNNYHQNNTLGIFEFFTEHYDQQDLDLFFAHFAKGVPQGTHPKLNSINGATALTTNASKAGGEAIIDLTVAFSLIYPQNITVYQTGFTTKQATDVIEKQVGPFENKKQTAGEIAIVENLLNAVDGSFCTPNARKQGLDCGTTSLTQVLSVSYGGPEINLPFKFAQRACNEYMKLALKGHTILMASGDYGPAGSPLAIGNETIGVSNACIDLKQPQNAALNGTVFNPEFPGTCPYVLTVGATQLNENETAKDAETAMHVPGKALDEPGYLTLGSSGGFSNYFKEPSYQASAVSKYFANHDPGYKTYDFPAGQKIGANGGLYAKGGRAFPDVSANGVRLASYTAGKFGREYGTSISTPIWASSITMINDERTAKGKGPVGFINPTLYKNTQIFNDITSGNAPGCGTDGFAATPGWDPTTGLGTPNYPKLLEVLLALP